MLTMGAPGEVWGMTWKGMGIMWLGRVAGFLRASFSFSSRAAQTAVAENYVGLAL